MTITGEDRAVVERWIGPILTSDEPDIEERLERLGSAYLTALEVLLRDRGEMVRTPGAFRSGDDSTDHRENMKRIDRLISDLVAVCLDTDIVSSLSTAGEILVAQAQGAAATSGGPIGVIIDNRRRG